MKKLATAIAAIALIGTPALAADMAVKARPMPPVPTPVFSWTGFYIGGNAGYGWGDANDQMTLGGNWLTDGTGDNLFVGPLGNHRLRPNGFTGGIETGYNYQIGPWVWGIEADWEYFGLKDSFSQTVTAASGDIYAVSSSFKSNWLVTVRPRVGYAFDRFLVYATGGLAIAHENFSQSIVQTNSPFAEAGSVSKTTSGWTVGAGTEYAFDNHWTVKAEYLYVDAGSISFSSAGFCTASAVVCAGFGPPSAFTGYTAAHSADLKVNIVRGGINYKF